MDFGDETKTSCTPGMEKKKKNDENHANRGKKKRRKNGLFFPTILGLRSPRHFSETFFWTKSASASLVARVRAVG